VDVGLMIWTVLVFGVLLFVLGRFAWKPMLAALDAREKGIQDAIDEANRQRDEAQRLMAEHQAQLADARRQAQQLMAEGREAAERLRKELEEKARAESATILDHARREIVRERDAAVETVRKESVDLALAAAARLLSERLDGERDRQLVRGYIDELGRSGAEA
jgi:F-type H+-transporting ATPase subunit b